MRTAPAVRVACTGGPLWRALRVGLPALASGAVAAWTLGHAGWSAAAAAAVVLLVAALAWRLTPPVARQLVWDGQCWAADGARGHLAVSMDIGPWLLLRLQPEAAPVRWVAVSAGEAGAAWHGLRAALYGPVPAPVLASSPGTVPGVQPSKPAAAQPRRAA